MKDFKDVEIAIIGTGIAGIATAYYLSVEHGCRSILLIDSRPAMSYTSAQSGDNYRNWWPHPTMTAFTNHSIELMERLARDTSNVFNMTRRGYALATRRKNIDNLIADLFTGYGDESLIRSHSTLSGNSYAPALSDDWTTAPNGVDVLSDAKLIQKIFPSFDKSVTNVLHIRRAGVISGQQLGQYMLEQIKANGGRSITAEVLGIEQNKGFKLTIAGSQHRETINADIMVNAAGPFAKHLAAMIDVNLPIKNIFHQKIAFEDARSLIPRDLPFAIDLDGKTLQWTDQEREWLASEPELAWLTKEIIGGTHCRPEGGLHSKWIKLGWAYNTDLSETQQDLINEPKFNPQFPEIVMRGAAELQPALLPYTQNLPTRRAHYGGYYPMTDENWPLIGPLNDKGAFVVGALSGFGSMSACAAGCLCAQHVMGKAIPCYATQLSMERYKDDNFMHDLKQSRNRGLL